MVEPSKAAGGHLTCVALHRLGTIVLFPVMVATVGMGVGGKEARAAESSGLSPLCSSAGFVRGDWWTRARFPRRGRYCGLLAQASARLSYDPMQALLRARMASRVYPRRPAPLLLMASARLRLGQAKEAVRTFEKALALDPQSLRSTPVLLDYARALRQSGRWRPALLAYRKVVYRLDRLSGVSLKADVLLETASTAMALGPEHLEESISFFERVIDLPYSDRRVEAVAWLALARSRHGDESSAVRILKQMERTRQLQALLKSWNRERHVAYLADDADLHAVQALLLEKSAPKRAVDEWQAYLRATARPVYAVHAKKHMERLRMRPSSRGPRGSNRRRLPPR